MSYAGYISAGAAALGAYSSYRSSQEAGKAADAQSAAVALQRRQQEIANVRQRRELIRSQRIASANNQARASAQGMVGSSSIAGIQGALNTNVSSNLNFLDVSNSLTQQRASFLDQASQAATRSNTFAAASKLGFTIGGKAFDIYRTTPDYTSLMKVLGS